MGGREFRVSEPNFAEQYHQITCSCLNIREEARATSFDPIEQLCATARSRRGVAFLQECERWPEELELPGVLFVHAANSSAAVVVTSALFPYVKGHFTTKYTPSAILGIVGV